jgi:hypothetical protein
MNNECAFRLRRAAEFVLFLDLDEFLSMPGSLQILRQPAPCGQIDRTAPGRADASQQRTPRWGWPKPPSALPEEVRRMAQHPPRPPFPETRILCVAAK